VDGVEIGYVTEDGTHHWVPLADAWAVSGCRVRRSGKLHLVTNIVIALADQNPSAADWIAAVGQALGALFTLAAVIVALWIALRDERRRHAEQERLALTQARLVRVPGEGSKSVGRDEHGYQHELTIYFTNHSERPVLDVYAEAWPADNPRDKPPRWALKTGIVLPGQDQPFMMKVTTPGASVTLNAWRVRWTDADGRQWCVDRRGEDPIPFNGQPPRPPE